MKSPWNMAAAIRTELEANPRLSLSECREAVQAAHPKQTINVNSFGVTFSNQRKRLGISPGKRKARKGVSRAAVRVTAPTTAPVAGNGEAVLVACRDLIAAAGGVEQAQAAIDMVKRLQIN